MKKLIETVQEAGRNGVALGHFNIADLVLLKGVLSHSAYLTSPAPEFATLPTTCRHYPEVELLQQALARYTRPIGELPRH